MSKARILIIDALYKDRETPVNTLLQAFGHTVEIIDPRVQEFESSLYHADLIVVYHTPPEIDGLDLAAVAQRSRSVPTILVSAQLDPDFLLAAMRVGVVDCLTIPTDQQKLLDAIERVLLNKRRATTVIHHMLEYSSNAMIALDDNNELLFFNAAAEELLAHLTPSEPAYGLESSIANPLLSNLLTQPMVDATFKRSEIFIEQTQKTMSVQVTIYPGFGRLAILQDISHLKEMDRIKSEFIERVSRDIRSPLTTVQGYVELIERMGPVNEQQKQFINRISFAVQSITALLSDLLELGRIEAGFEADREPTHFAMVLRYALEGAQQTFTQKNLQLEVTLPEETSTVMGNPLRLRQMIDSLVENAIKFTPEGGRIRVSLSVKDTFLVFQITDTGIGIPLEDQPHVFEKFYRASNSRDRFKGAGLGLSIVKGIVDKHNGRIWLESQDSVGTQFTVMLPIQSDHSEAS